MTDEESHTCVELDEKGEIKNITYTPSKERLGAMKTFTRKLSDLVIETGECEDVTELDIYMVLNQHAVFWEDVVKKTEKCKVEETRMRKR